MPKGQEGSRKDKTTIENHNYFEDFMDTKKDTVLGDYIENKSIKP